MVTGKKDVSRKKVRVCGDVVMWDVGCGMWDVTWSENVM